MKISFLFLCVFCISCTHAPDLKPSLEKSTHQLSIQELRRSMPSAEKGADLIFATYEPEGLDPENSFYEFSPAIIIKRDNTPAEFISWPEFTKYGWVSGTQLPSLGYYWGVLDYQVEAPMEELIIIWSHDFGKTWSQLSTLKKNSYGDEFFSLVIDKKGNGSAVIKRIDSGDTKTLGFDIFSTHDFGKTWSAPIFQKSTGQLKNSFKNACSFSMKPTKKIPIHCAIVL